MFQLPIWTRACVFLVVATGCASQPRPKMRVGAPLENEGDLFFRRRFSQEGQVVDTVDVVRNLKQDPASKRHVTASQAWRTVATLTGAAGGALVGWPVGEAIAGKTDPSWELAAVGGALTLTALSLAVLSESQLHRAARAYNESLTTAGPAPTFGTWQKGDFDPFAHLVSPHLTLEKQAWSLESGR
jgi:hypothetical protein